MKTDETQKQVQENSSNQRQNFFVQPHTYLSKDGDYLTLVLPGNMIVRKHVNYFKAILGLEFTPKVKQGA